MELPQEVPESGLGDNVVGREDPHSEELWVMFVRSRRHGEVMRERRMEEEEKKRRKVG